ncbi:MAG: multicopper oxidase domain-containing protein, partial [Motiliproteus sp.]|nr:multicopper oxidase domain-containing protein [Motiliproteus sp.]
SKMSDMDHSNMSGMDHSKMSGMDHSDMSSMDHSKMSGMSNASLIDDDLDLTQMTLDASQNKKAKLNRGPRQLPPSFSQSVKHASTEYGPHVDMRAENPVSRLDDPGVGLRNNGRRVLTYGDLYNRYKTPDPREPSREIELHLTGNMSRYMWSINGIKFADSDPIQLKYGERVRITFVNDTMMNHPMHLHGMWSDLETGDPGYIPRKHTVVVQPGARISYLVTADARGDWAYHCHLIYHMLGMFRKVTVS